MNPEIRDKWTDALRSGDFPQGTEYLKRENAAGINEYCCFGVLAEVLDIPQTNYGIGILSPTYFTFSQAASLQPTQSAQIPPRAWCESLGIDAGSRNRLMDMNDGNGEYTGPVSFSDIAEWIEENL